MSAIVFGYCNIDEINTYNLDLQDLITILSLKNYEPIPHYTNKRHARSLYHCFRKCWYL